MNATQDRIDLTSNPFVDTGLAVIAALSELDDVRHLTRERLAQVYEDGAALASLNAKLNSYSQIFGTNNPLFQKGYGYAKNRGPSSINRQIYQTTLSRFIDPALSRPGRERCAACGTNRLLDFEAVTSAAIEAAGKKAPRDKSIGRDWFPLAGSLGSDAQALPSASRSVSLCGTCLFAIHYLPMGILLLDGRPTVFQSTSTEFWYALVRNVVDEMRVRTRAGEFAAIGAKEGRRAILRRLLSLFKDVKSEAFGADLFLWRFSNSGASPECGIERIPSRALEFLYICKREGLSAEIEACTTSERGGRASFLDCVSRGADYDGLYPRKKWAGASPKLYSMYQQRVRGFSERAVALASAIARGIAGCLRRADLKRLIRAQPWRDPLLRRATRISILKMAGDGELCYADYLELFPVRANSDGLQTESRGRAMVWFFLLHRPNDAAAVPPFRERPQPENPNVVVRLASQIYTQKVEAFGQERFRRDVLARFERGALGKRWLQSQFTALAESTPGFTYSEWAALTGSDSGPARVNEVLFQIRVLFLEWSARPPHRNAAAPELPPSSGLPPVVDEILRRYFFRYLAERGAHRFGRDVLRRLQRREIGIPWLMDRLREPERGAESPRLSAEQWEDFVRNASGYVIAAERLFQSHLLLANLYRTRSVSKTPGDTP